MSYTEGKGGRAAAAHRSRGTIETLLRTPGIRNVSGRPGPPRCCCYLRSARIDSAVARRRRRYPLWIRCFAMVIVRWKRPYCCPSSRQNYISGRYNVWFTVPQIEYVRDRVYRLLFPSGARVG